MEDVNNFGKFDGVDEDEGNISESKTHMMPPVGSSTEATWFRRCCPYTHRRILT
jgi:hypothetical protein